MFLVYTYIRRQALLTEKPGRISLVQGRASSILIGRIFDAVRAEILPLKIGSMSCEFLPAITAFNIYIYASRKK